MEKVTHELKQLRKLAALLQSAWHYGEFKAETVNEREMEAIMEERGYWPVTLSAHTMEPNLLIQNPKPHPTPTGGEMTMTNNMNNNPGTTNGTSTTLDLINNHIVIRETVGYNFLNNIAIEDIPEVMEFLKLVFNYIKIKDKTNE